MALRPVLVDKRSPFLGEVCALCKEPLAPGDELAICPEDATRHHVYCWRANGDKCTAYGCTGHGEVVDLTVPIVRRNPRSQSSRRSSPADQETKVQTLPARGFHCAQSCLLISIALAIILIAIGCFGIWAIADYVMIEVLGWHYRAPVSGLIPIIGIEQLARDIALAAWLI